MTTQSLTIYSLGGTLRVREDFCGTIVGTVKSDTTITASTDSYSVIAEVDEFLPGRVVSVDHDKGTIMVSCEVAECDEPSSRKCRDCDGKGYFGGDGLSEDSTDCASCGGSGSVPCEPNY